MAQITIRNLNDAVLQALKRRAAAAGRSTEEEARRALAMAAGQDRSAARARLDTVRAKLATFGEDRDAGELVRRQRDERTDQLSG
jgi:plasmid stability protein